MKGFVVLPVLKEALHARVCSVCINGNADGTCGVFAQHDCALFENISRIAEAVSRTGVAGMRDYAAALQESICDQCFHQHLDGSCELRGQDRCALFRYLGEVIETMRLQE
jgi:hypothetical protein